ncbi:MAG: hypothetical protein E7293_09620 [Lachnospiraceae bacterium]|nr:hypothetical protein [Lachnospiraceae bacterium]
MNRLQAGFARGNITPRMGIFVRGYYKPRYADGVLDELELNALALACDNSKVLLISIDHCGLDKDTCTAYRKHISEKTGVPMECVFLSSTHTHTGPQLLYTSTDPLEKEYFQFLYGRMADVAQFALDDLKPARMGYGVGTASNISFIRRFRMKDGSVRTNPGVDNPDILHPIGNVDERVNVLRFDQENGNSLVLVNFGNHPDTVGGSKISADWPGFLRKTVEKTLDNTRCIFFNGAQGDVNHVNVHPRGGYLNDMFMDFDDVSRGYKHAQYIGRVVTAGVLQAYDKVQYTDVETLQGLQRTISIPSNMPSPEELPEAHRINDLHNAGRDYELPYKGMQLTTIVAQAARMVQLEHGPNSFDMDLIGISIGPISLIGIPGEPFNGIGLGLKEAPGWDLVLPCCLTNGNQGYFPMQDAYDEGGYEAKSSVFKAGVAELIIQEGIALLDALH